MQIHSGVIITGSLAWRFQCLFFATLNFFLLLSYRDSLPLTRVQRRLPDPVFDRLQAGPLLHSWQLLGMPNGLLVSLLPSLSLSVSTPAIRS